MLSKRSHSRRLGQKVNSFSANSLSFLNPELLSREAVLRLLPKLILSRLVVRNFDVTPALFGEAIQIPRPGSFVMTRKDGVCDNVVTQDITGDRIQAFLNQWPQVSFRICDGESRDVPTLIRDELTPAVQALAEGLDLIVAGQIQRFYAGPAAGHLGLVTAATVNDYILDTFEVMNEQNVPDDNRILALTGPTVVAGLKNDLFVRADQSGSTDALRRANLGQLYGFDLVSSNNVPNVRADQPVTTAAINNSPGGYPAGTTTVAYNGIASGPFVAGAWVKIAGDDAPQHITSLVSTTGLVISPGLRRAVAHGAVITGIIGGAVNNGPGYRGYNSANGVPGYAKEITVSGFTVAPKIGQGITFGTGTAVYAVIGVNGLVGITLDRPLDVAIANGDAVQLMPAGQYNMAFRPAAFALILRPLAPAIAGAGALSQTANYNGFSVRVTIAYDSSAQAHKVTLDLLAGINTIDAHQVVPMWG